MLVLSGCASNIPGGGMVYVDEHPCPTHLAHKISAADVHGGHQTNPFWTPQITNENFKYALQESLKHADLYSVPPGEYQLSAQLMQLSQRYFGVSFPVTCVVHYTLQKNNMKKPLYDKTISTTYTGTFSDSLIATVRLHIATQKAAQLNIQSLINDLNQL